MYVRLEFAYLATAKWKVLTVCVQVADSGNNQIRKVKYPEGSVTTLAGVREGGYANGSCAEAKFNMPTDVAVDGRGTVIVADSDNNVLRQIMDGRVSTFAGRGHSFGVGREQDGPALSATFHRPCIVRICREGDVYVVDRDADSHWRRIENTCLCAPHEIRKQQRMKEFFDSALTMCYETLKSADVPVSKNGEFSDTMLQRALCLVTSNAAAMSMYKKLMTDTQHAGETSWTERDREARDRD